MSKYTELATDSWYLKGDHSYLTINPIEWYIGKPHGPKIVVPSYFTFDVTVNWFTRLFVDPNDTRYLKAAALHDYLLYLVWDRQSAGAVFNSALKADGVGIARRFAMWLAVSVWKFS